MKDNVFSCFLFFKSVHKSRSTRRSKAAEPNELPAAASSHVTSDTNPGVSQTTRLKELLSPTSCSQPCSLKPRPPSTPRVREQPSSSASTAAAHQTDGIGRRCPPVKRRDGHIAVRTASGKTDADSVLQKPRNRKEQTSGNRAVKDQTPTPLIRSCSSINHKSPQRKPQSATHAPISKHMHREHELEACGTRDKAARTIQRAWQR